MLKLLQGLSWIFPGILNEFDVEVGCVCDKIRFFCVYIHESRCLKVRKLDGSVVYFVMLVMFVGLKLI